MRCQVCDSHRSEALMTRLATRMYGLGAGLLRTEYTITKYIRCRDCTSVWQIITYREERR